MRYRRILDKLDAYLRALTELTPLDSASEKHDGSCNVHGGCTHASINDARKCPYLLNYLLTRLLLVDPGIQWRVEQQLRKNPTYCLGIEYAIERIFGDRIDQMNSTKTLSDREILSNLMESMFKDYKNALDGKYQPCLARLARKMDSGRRTQARLDTEYISPGRPARAARKKQQRLKELNASNEVLTSVETAYIRVLENMSKACNMSPETFLALKLF
jgi:hypothetical protein